LGRRLGGEELYDCESCRIRPGLYQILGHDGPPIGTMWRENLIDGKPLERCPLRTLQLADPLLVAEINRHVNEYFPFYEDGHLLVAGGISDQPARSIAYMLEIRRVWSIVDTRHAEFTQSEGAE
jgi:hypothetical protein